jgi:hypothetical protein
MRILTFIKINLSYLVFVLELKREVLWVINLVHLMSFGYFI